jgi:photosystem II stability/assembly factor-like uncharacterized protein
MRVTHRMFAFVSLLALCLFPCTLALAGDTFMHLISLGKGWAIGSNQKLFWTNDNGAHWTDISPKTASHLSDVFFLDSSYGWVLLSDYDEQTNLASIHIASTTDTTGQSWKIVPVKVHSQEPDELSGKGWLDFADSIHGWLVLYRNSSAAFSLARLFATVDGGASWEELLSPPVAGHPVFVSPQDGWLSGPGWAGMYSTHDGGRSWKGGGPSLGDLPPSLPSQPSYGEVKFSDAKHGFVPVWLQASNDAEEPRGTALILYVTDDGGQTWKRDRTLTDRGTFSKYGAALSRIGAASVVPDPSGTGAILVVTFNDRKHRNRVTLITVAQGEIASDTASAKRSENALWRTGDDIAELSFVTSTQGWARTSLGDLLLTMDGGSTWKDISPIPAVRPATRSVTVSPSI